MSQGGAAGLAHLPVIRKPSSGWAVMPNLLDYEASYAAFRWEDARRELDGLPDGRGLNIAHEAVDRHLRPGRGGKIAMRWLGKNGERREFTYKHLAAATTGSPIFLSNSAYAKGSAYSRCLIASRNSMSRPWAVLKPAAYFRRCSPPLGRNRCGRASLLAMLGPW